MERHVVSAALAVSRASTPPEVRSQASNWLDSWARTDDAPTWEAYANLIGLFFPSERSGGGTTDEVLQLAAETAPAGTPRPTLENDLAGAQMLVLATLHAKIRREYAASPILSVQRPDVAARLREGLWSALSQSGDFNAPLAGHLCSCAAAVAARSPGGARDIVSTCHGSLVAAASLSVSAVSPGPPRLSPWAALKMLACLPDEADLSEATGSEVDAELDGCCRAVLDGTTWVVATVTRGESGGGGGWRRQTRLWRSR